MTPVFTHGDVLALAAQIATRGFLFAAGLLQDIRWIYSGAWRRF
jgi:hypothetical protein